MADLFSLLSQSGASLGTHRAASTTASHNLQNADTPGYSRQSAQIGNALPADMVGGAFIGRGARLLGITQARDRFLEAQVPRALAGSEKANTEARALEAFTSLDPGDESGVTHEMAAFFESMRLWSQNPGEPALRTSVVGAAERLTTSIRAADGQVSNARDALDEDIGAQVSRVNALTRRLAALNQQAATAAAEAGGPPNDILDEQVRVRDELAQLTGATSVTDGKGNLLMFLPGGQALVGERDAARLRTEPDPANRGHVGLRITSLDGQSESGVRAARIGGAIRGNLDARDGAMKDAQDQLDTFTFDMATALNAAHSAGFAMDGSTGRDLLDVGASAAGAAGRVTVNAALVADPRLLAGSTDPAAPSGDPSGVFALIDVEQAALSGGSNPLKTWSAIVSGYGDATESARTEADLADLTKTHLEGLRESVSGVSIDEELINLTKSQRAYEAVLEVIKTADEMLQTLMSIAR